VTKKNQQPDQRKNPKQAERKGTSLMMEEKYRYDSGKQREGRSPKD